MPSALFLLLYSTLFTCTLLCEKYSKCFFGFCIYGSKIYILVVVVIIYIGDSDRPSIKELHILEVINTAAPKWYELGLELLNEDIFGEFEVANRGDVKKCCSEMFQYWLKMDLNASWKKLIAALKQPSVGVNTLALSLEERFIGEWILIILHTVTYIINCFLIEPTQVKLMSGKSLPPSFSEQKLIKKHGT